MTIRTGSHSRYLARILGIVIAGIAAAAVHAAGPPPAPVVIATANEKELSPTSWMPGSVESRNDAEIAAEVTGRLQWVAEVGTRVSAGEAVARLDNTQIKLQVQELEAVVEREKAQLRFLAQEAQRLERLASENNAARNRLDEVQANRDTTRSDLAAARARLGQAQDRLERHSVGAPFDGVVAERLRRAGEWVDNGNAVVRLVDPATLEIKAMVPLQARPFLSPGQRLMVDDGIATTAAELRSLVPVGESRSRLLDLRLDIDAAWTAGETVRVAVPTAATQRVTVIPRDALVIRRDSTAVFRIGADNTAERIEVTPGIAEGQWIAVSGGIQPGDRVVIRGGERLRPGQNVTITSTQQATIQDGGKQ